MTNFILFTIIVVVTALEVEDYANENQLRDAKIQGKDNGSKISYKIIQTLLGLFIENNDHENSWI